MAVQYPKRVEIIDIRRDKDGQSLVQLMLDGLGKKDVAARHMPTLLLYDERGLKLFEEITYLNDYYLTNEEIEVLDKHADALAERIPPSCRLVELGSGNLRKVKILLQAIERLGKPVYYFALDLSLSELERTFSEITVESYNYVKLAALHGTYDDGLAWLKETADQYPSTSVLTLGSSIGNFSRQEAAEFLESFSSVLGPADYLLVGLDACQDPDRIYRAYNDSKHVTHEFYRNGLDHANRLLGYEAFKQSEWAIVGQYDKVSGRHEAFYQALKKAVIAKMVFQMGDLLKLEDAFKYSTSQSDQLWHDAGLINQIAYTNARGDYNLHLLTPCKVSLPTRPSEYAVRPVPSIREWQELWVLWDTATRAMIPAEELMEKPIKLRNNLIFYLGHIPAFADIHMTRATAGKPTDPAYYHSIFERGIDPDVDNPEVCHQHSEIPDTWPPLEEMLSYQARVRSRVTSLTEAANDDRRIARALWLAFEHEAMHLETFLYMLLQSERVLPPPGRPTPDFKALAVEAEHSRLTNKWYHVTSTVLTLGLDDAENDIGPDRYFGWDNERPPRKVTVGPFEAQARPVSNGDYAKFLDATTAFGKLPASWTTCGLKYGLSNGYTGEVSTNGANGHVEHSQNGAGRRSFVEGKFIRTVYGPVPLQLALDWPVMGSYDELAAYAMWVGGRIPTLGEVRSIYNYVEQRKKEANEVPNSLISAVNGHLVNEGVEETPPQGRRLACLPNGKAKLHPQDLFIDLDGCNVGFRHWHPTGVTNTDQLRGHGDAGGLWEWTSSHLANYEGFKAMDLYPGYSEDFFDTKHNIVVGGSWATHPRIAGRKTFVNWYQRNYPYTWATARLVRDVSLPN